MFAAAQQLSQNMNPGEPFFCLCLLPCQQNAHYGPEVIPYHEGRHDTGMSLQFVQFHPKVIPFVHSSVPL